jgi:hypothetical protein
LVNSAARATSSTNSALVIAPPFDGELDQTAREQQITSIDI